jgi:hypothetical protein
MPRTENRAEFDYKKFYEKNCNRIIQSKEMFMMIKVVHQLKWVWQGKKLPLDKPKIIVILSVEDSNAPIPILRTNPWPIFKIKKLTPEPIKPDAVNQEFLGILDNVVDYFNAPNEQNNGPNKLDEPGNEFTSSAFFKAFDTLAQANDWEQKTLDEIQAFLDKLRQFVRVDFKDKFSWTGEYMNLMTVSEIKDVSEKTWRKNNGLDEPDDDEEA